MTEACFKVGDLPLGGLASASTRSQAFAPNAVTKLHCQDMLSKGTVLCRQDPGHTERLCSEHRAFPVNSLLGKNEGFSQCEMRDDS